MFNGRPLFFVILGMMALCLPTAQAVAAGHTKEIRAPGAEIFDNKTVLALRIQISSNELATLRKNDRQDVRATVWEGTNVYHDVGLHVKGAAGSRQAIDGAKPALTLNFQKFIPHQRFHSLRKIHLNNSVQDGSYLTENICSELYRRAGVPTPRVTYATLELNGTKRGLYVVKEGFTRELLGMYFKRKDGNLYDGGFLREVDQPLERDLEGEGDVKDWSDLKALVKAARISDPEERFVELSKVLDMERFITYAALQIMTWDWDGYVMNRNNYRIYHDRDTGKMVFMPHGMDQMFWETDHQPIPIPNRFNGLVAQQVINTPQGRRLYKQRFGEVFTNVFQIELLTNRVNQLGALLTPYVGNTNDYRNQVANIRNKVVAQHANFARRLSEPEPVPIQFLSRIASVTNWSIPLTPPDRAKAIRDRVAFDGRQTLHILTTNTMTNTTASWRANVMLGPGSYRFEALARSAGVVPVPATFTNDLKKGVGAGIRQHASSKPRSNQLLGDTVWQKLEYGFTNKFEEAMEFELLCELRAVAGEVWFDADSLRLIKTGGVPPPKPKIAASAAEQKQ
jgi:spore coat protein CotH